MVVSRKKSNRWHGPLRSAVDSGFYIEDSNEQLKLFAKSCVRRYAAGLSLDLSLDEYSALLSTLQHDDERPQIAWPP